jgi:hypothetical protein
MDPKTNRRTEKRAETSVFDEPSVRKQAKAGLELTVDVANAVDGNAYRRRSGLAKASTGKSGGSGVVKDDHKTGIASSDQSEFCVGQFAKYTHQLPPLLTVSTD